MLNEIKDWSDDQVFGGAGEQPGSQASYYREVEMRRRQYILERELLNSQLAATEAQNRAVEAQREATAEARRQSSYILYSTIFSAMSAAAALTAVAITLLPKG